MLAKVLIIENYWFYWLCLWFSQEAGVCIWDKEPTFKFKYFERSYCWANAFLDEFPLFRKKQYFGWFLLLFWVDFNTGTPSFVLKLLHPEYSFEILLSLPSYNLCTREMLIMYGNEGLFYRFLVWATHTKRDINNKIEIEDKINSQSIL